MYNRPSVFYTKAPTGPVKYSDEHEALNQVNIIVT